MQLTEEQFNEIQDLFPKPRGNVRWGHRRVLNGILYILKHGCPWRSLPACYGRWNTVYVQMRRWAERGVLAAVFERLRDRGLVASDTEMAMMLDSTSVKVHADGTGSLKKRSAKYRSLARRADHQGAFAGIGRSSGVEFLAVRRASARCSGGSPAAPAERSEAPKVCDYGPCV